jgi:hypothetical protein
MKRTLQIALLLLSVQPLFGQLWSGVLASNRAINWSNVGATITNRTTICTTLGVSGQSSSYRQSVTAAQINSAISSCPAGEVVYLNAGTYNLSGSIVTTTNNVTLRGEGANQTLLVFSGTSSNCNGLGATVVCVWNGDSGSYVFNNLNSSSWTGGYSSGTTQITLASTTNLHIGSMLILDQRDDASDTGNVYVCQTYGSDGNCSQQGGGGNTKPDRAQTQSVQVTNKKGKTVTITPGLYAPQWSSGKSPEASWSSTLPITGFGIENLDLDFSAAGSGGFGIMFEEATNCWVKGIRSVNGVSTGASFATHIIMYQANHITVRDSYFYGSNPASQGYGINPNIGSSDILVENNITQHVATGFVGMGTTGSVFGYNYAVDDSFGGHWQQGDSFHHCVFDDYVLWEGHEGIEFIADDIHGTSAFLTQFRSYFSGHDPATENGAKTQATFAYFPMANSRYLNLVGSVLGTWSYHSLYEYAPSSTSDCGSDTTGATAVLVFGFSQQGGAMFAPSSGHAVNCPANHGSFDIYDDTSQYTGSNTGNIMLWGNYAACNGDSSCNAVRWQSSENASGASTYPGLASPSETLPASFYYSSRPSWWGTMPWPAIGPDVTGGTVANVGGHVYLTPAANCYLNVMGGKTDGSSGVLTFNANSCYGSRGVPQPR